jgi:hypothetical protein
MDPQSNALPSPSDLARFRKATAMAEKLRGMSVDQVRRAVAEGRMTQKELRQLQQFASEGRPFLRLDLEQALKYAEESKQVHQQGLDALRSVRVSGAPRPTGPTVTVARSDRKEPGLHRPATSVAAPSEARSLDAGLGQAMSAPSSSSPPPAVRMTSQAPLQQNQEPVRSESKPAAPQRKLVRRRRTEETVIALPVAVEPPRSMAGAIAQQHVHRTRSRVLDFLRHAGLGAQIEDLKSLEERLSVGTRPALQHAALSTRVLFLGVADHCFPSQAQPWVDASGNKRPVEQSNVGNRLIAYVEAWLGTGSGSKDREAEFRAFVAVIDTLGRWNGRGPHRIRDLEEGGRFFIHALETLDRVGKAHRTALRLSGNCRAVQARPLRSV